MNYVFRPSLRAAALFCSALFFFVSGSRAQYTDSQAIEDLGGPPEFAARRAELIAQVKTGYTLLFARNDIPESAHYREDNDFYYYTGVQDPGAILAMDNATGHIILFEPQQASRTAQVYGPNLLSQPEEAKRLGFPAVQPIGNLDMWLSNVLSAHPQVNLWLRLGFPDKADGARPEEFGHGIAFGKELRRCQIGWEVFVIGVCEFPGMIAAHLYHGSEVAKSQGNRSLAAEWKAQRGRESRSHRSRAPGHASIRNRSARV